MVRSKLLDTVDSDTMSLDELAGRLGISLTSAYEKAQRDALPIPKVPGLGRYRYSRRLYDKLMDTGALDAGHDGKAA